VAGALLAACGSSSVGSGPAATAAAAGHSTSSTAGLYGALPSSGTPATGGTITMGQLTGSTPTYIFPIVPGANATDGTDFLIDQLWLPLYNLQVGGSMQVNYATSAAQPPTFSDGDRRVTIKLRSGLNWSNGKPVTANDVLFDLALTKAAVKESAANWSLYTPGLIPDNVISATAPNSRTVVLTFNRAYNPAYLTDDQLAGTLSPLPSTVWNVASQGGAHLNWRTPANAKKIYNYLAKAAGSLSTFASNPLWQTVDGPFKLGSFSAASGAFNLDANRSFTLTGKVKFSNLAVQTFTSTTSQLNAMLSGSLDVGTLDFSQLSSAPTLRRDGYAAYGYPNIGTFGINLNYKDTTDDFGKVISQLYARQALAHLEDQTAYLTGILKGAASTAYGPLPTIPKTPFTPADAGTDPYPYSVSAAAKLLKEHGWKVVPSGQTTCEKPGTGAGECGAGIPAGTPFKFTLLSTPADENTSIPLESEALASAAHQVGIDVTLVTKTFNYLIGSDNDADPADVHNESAWGATNWGEFGTTPYPTEEGEFNTGGDFNVGDYSDAQTDKLMKQAVYGNNPAVATQLADYLAKQLPMLYLPCADVVDAVSNKVGGTSDSWLAMTQDVWYPQYWYLKK
jgi:peptide/nickel transport system substrate-binding protein